MTRPEGTRRRLSCAILGLFLLVVLPPIVPTSASPAPSVPVPLARFVGSSGLSFRALAAGAVGSGTLVYFTRANGAKRPTLIVQLNRDRNTSFATAQVYAATRGPSYLVLAFHGSEPVIPASLHPAISMVAHGGWWFRNGVPNYNLSISVKGNIYAMWGYPTYAKLAPAFAFSIETRANAQGVPRWDFRTLITGLTGHSVMRTNYVERQCSIPLHRAGSPTPLWPYVAYHGKFEQSVQSMEPPIVVDWRRGRIDALSEIVGLRAESCGYGMYSLDQITRHSKSEPSFESPWGLYDFSGKHTGLPNLLIRTEHFPAGSQWYSQVDRRLSPLPAPQKPSEAIRYSWANHVGNYHYDYKVDVFGFRPYTSVQTLADGAIHVVQPGYSEYPNWVIHHRWPLTTFVDGNSASYATSEGIYDWSARDIGTDYWLGWNTKPNLKQFDTIFAGLRGEYRLTGNYRPLLYASDIDHRLHLLNAEGGLWNIGAGVSLRERNLLGGAHIDDWQLLHSAQSASGSHTSGRVTTTEETAALHGYVLSSGPRGVTIRKALYHQEAFRVLPPTDAKTWSGFVSRTSTYQSLNVAPAVETWADKMSGPVWHVSSGRLSDIRGTPTGFSALLHVTNRSHASGGIPGLKSPDTRGAYVLRYDAPHSQWTVQRGSPPQITVRLVDPAVIARLLPTSLVVHLHNASTESWTGKVTLDITHDPAGHATRRVVLDSRALDLPGNQDAEYTVQWAPKSSGKIPVGVSLGRSAPTIHVLTVHPTPRPSARTMVAGSISSRWPYLESLALALFVVAGTTVLWKRAYGRV